MRIDSRFLGWGVFFVLAGALPLAVQAGWLDAPAVAGWWRFWPLLIVGIGAGILLRDTSAHLAGGLIVAATFGLMAGGLFAGGFFAGGGIHLGDVACGGGTGSAPFPTQAGSFANGGTVALDFRCGELTATTGGDTWSVAGTSRDGSGPLVESAPDRLSVRARDIRMAFPSFFDTGEAWRVAIPSKTTGLDLTMNAGTGRLDLAGTSVSRVSATVNAGDVRLRLGQTPLSAISVTVNAGSATLDLPATSVTGSLTVNAGAIRFCVPAGVGLELTTNDNITGGNNFGQRGLTKSGATWRSSDWATALTRLSLSATANVGGLTLNPKEGCT